jgi:hypothetical protein
MRESLPGGFLNAARDACHTLDVVRFRTLPCALAAVGVSAVVLAGCGSSGYSGPNVAKGLSATALAGASQKQVALLKTFVLGVSGTTTVALQPKALPSASPLAILGSGIPISGTGPVIAPNAFSLALSVTVGGTAAPLTLTQLGGHVYAIALGRTMLLPTTGAIVNVKSLIVGIIHVMTSPSIGSTSSIDGIPSIELTGHINGRLAAQGLAPLLSLLPRSSTAKPTAAEQHASLQALVSALSQGTVHDWVRVSDLRPARVEVVASIPNGATVAAALEHASIAMTFDLSDYDQTQIIVAPLHAVPITTTQLHSLLTG